jgi:integrase/recombinase XerD
MYDKGRYTEPNFTGQLSQIITGFVRQKRLTGCVYNTELIYLKKIDSLASKLGWEQNCLPKELVEQWTAKGRNESQKTWQNRIVIIRQLAVFMQSLNYEAYITPIVLKRRPSNFIPHIFTGDQLRMIFEYADTTVSYPNCPNRTAVTSLLFRMLYCCGLRISEALNLKLRNVDMEHGVLTIYGAKNDIARLVPMSPELTHRCVIYQKDVLMFSSADDYFFPAPQGGKYGKDAIYAIWRQLLLRSGITYRGRAYGPRIHDLRHTFAVNCLKKWFRGGVDINVALPLLSAYLGHVGITSTEIYLRLTAELFPDITRMLEEKYGDIIMAIPEGFYEAE